MLDTKGNIDQAYLSRIIAIVLVLGILFVMTTPSSHAFFWGGLQQLTFPWAHSDSKKIGTCPDCNVILISLDTLRADHLGAYGYSRNTSPNIDALAQESIVFHNAFANAYFTLPSHMSIFTGLYPIKHGINVPNYRSNVPGDHDKLPAKYMTIAQVLQDHQYFTSWIGILTDQQLDLERGFERGFSEFHDTFFGKGGIDKDSIKERVMENNGRKFFWFVHSYVNHAPYIYPDEYGKTYLKDGSALKMPDSLEEYFKPLMTKLRKEYDSNKTKVADTLRLSKEEMKKLELSLHRNDVTMFREWNMEVGPMTIDAKYGASSRYYFDAMRKGMSEELLQELNARYDQGIVYADFMIGELVSELKRAGLWDNTIVIITSDHGEELYEHRDFGHGKFYDETIHVPVIIRVPGLIEQIDYYGIVQSIDIFPSLMHVLEIKIPEEIQGADQISVIRGQAKKTTHAVGFSNGDKYIRSKNWKYIEHWNGKEELYDLNDDQRENINTINMQPEAYQKARESLRKEMYETLEIQ